MRAIVLIGGEGTRLRPLTWRTPKQLVPVLNRPLLEHLLRQLHTHGIERVSFAMTGPNAPIEKAFGDGSALGLRIERVYEGEPAGSGGAIAHAAGGWDEPFLVCNGDIVSDIDLSAFIAEHRRHEAELSLALYEVDDPSRFGVVVLDDGGRVTRFVEKPSREEAPSHLINAGYWLFEPAVAAELDAYRFNRVEDDLFPRLAGSGRGIRGYRHHGYWMDVGSPVAYLRANLDLLRGAVGELLPDGWPASEQAIEAADVSAAARIAGPALLGAGTTVGAGTTLDDGVVTGERCHIGEDAHVATSVLWDDVHVGAGARVLRSTLASGVRIGTGAVVEGAVLAHGAEVAAGERPAPGTQLEPDASYRDGAIVAAREASAGP